MEKKYSKKQEVILITAVVMLVLLLAGAVFGITYAWYTRIKNENIGLRLADPVEIFVTDSAHEVSTGDIVTPEGTPLYPGSRIVLGLGFTLGSATQASSDAYVRVKLSISVQDFPEGSTDDAVTFNAVPDPSYWEEVVINGEKWWVLINRDGFGNPTARIAENGDTYNFINGTVTISTALGNAYANKKIDIKYTVSAIQEKNVENPLLNGVNNATWGKQSND